MSTPATFVVNGIQSLLSTQSLVQRLLYPDTEPFDTFSLDNQFVPTPSVDSITNFEIRNYALSGYRWVHTTDDSDTYGDFSLQRFVSASPTGTSLMGFSEAFSNFKILIDTSFTQPVEFASDVTISGTTTFNDPVVINGGMTLNSTVSISPAQQNFDFGTATDSSVFLIKNTYSTPALGYYNTLAIGAGEPLGPGFAFSYTYEASSNLPGEFHLYPMTNSSIGTAVFNVAYDVSSNYIFELTSNVRIGTNTQTVSTNSRFEVNSTLAYNTIHSGTQTAQTGNNQICNYINPTLSPADQITGYVAGNVITPTITVPNVSNPAISAGYGQFINLSINGTAGKTLTNSYGTFVGAGSLSTASVTNSYSGYFTNPGFGTNKTALYADNLSIGVTGSTPPSNGMLISGSINSSSTTDSTSASTGAFFTSGGIGIAKSLFCTGNGTFSFANATAGTLLVQNTNNSSGSSANITVKVGGASGDDPTQSFNVNGVTTWTIGIDNDNATTGVVDGFVIGASASLGSNDMLIISKNGNFGFNGYSAGGGLGIMFIANRATAPTSNPTGGGILYSEGGALKWRGSGGTTTTIAVA